MAKNQLTVDKKVKALRYRVQKLGSLFEESTPLELKHVHARRVLHRRRYYVQSPNDLWHINGYHKLIRWHIVIHGGIDGYSRLITFLKAATNNRSETMFQAFQSGMTEFSLPCRIRMDKGGENVLVAQYMLDHPDRGVERGSAIVGRSVHAQPKN